LLESVSKVGAALGLAAYVAGVLVVNGYLYGLGVAIADPSVVRGRLVYTGAGALLLGIASVGARAYWLRAAAPMWLLGVFAKQAEAPDRSERRAGQRRAIGVIFLVLPFALLCAMTGQDTNGSLAETIARAFDLDLFAVVTGASVALGYSSWKTPRLASLPRWMPVVALSAIGTASLLGYLLCVGQFVYPNLPQQVGGGRAESACLLLTGQGARAARASGVELGRDQMTRPLDVILRQSESFIVRTSKGDLVELSTKLIQGTVTARVSTGPKVMTTSRCV
jgi:hypothetical protein